MSDKKFVGDSLKKQVFKKGVNRTKLAEYVGLSRTQFYAIINESFIKEEYLLKINEYLLNYGETMSGNELKIQNEYEEMKMKYIKVLEENIELKKVNSELQDKLFRSHL